MKKKKIHFVGIKGTNMTSLSLVAKEAGFDVTGSDVNQEFITDAALKKAGIIPQNGFLSEHITDQSFVITTGAHGGFENIEVQTAKMKHIPVMSAGEATGEFMNGSLFKRKFIGISIAGTHGKTTTTAMVATMLKENRLDPSYIIGTGDVGSLGAPGHFGEGRYFVAEADEYATEPKYDRRARFLWQHPTFAVITNIEHDHPDIYPTISAVREAFLSFVKKLPEKGLLIACGDDPQIKLLLQEYEGRVITYGFSLSNDYVLERVTISGEQTFFWVESHGVPLGEFAIRVAGEHNALNALAAIIVGIELRLSIEKIKKGLLIFRGSKRRLEFIGTLRTGAKVYDDYAHHPTEIKTTLQALRIQYPKKKIICIFQPHTYSRTKHLFNEFIMAFGNVDQVILTDIFASAREKIDPSVSSKHLAFALGNLHKSVLYLPKLTDVVQYISENRFRTDTVLVTMGAGDVYTIHSEFAFI
ncbi:MAG TPA: UDP-N-acetylmuramate--L-alanine ligase [Candidatus Sulfotelmatobacter sp.]|jgi:UDP-N-acetylmuramate--alanine ligase|nr:UDP-N-acetylmuramate--L-alanine ligase [Candidatus Sulfotelmatobacter sp.]